MKMISWADHNGHFWQHPSAFLAVIVWESGGGGPMAKVYSLNKIPSNFTARSRREVWCDRGLDHMVEEYRVTKCHVLAYRLFFINTLQTL